MSNLSINTLENNIIDKIFKPTTIRGMEDLSLAGLSSSKALSQKELVTYAFRDFVNYFLRLEELAKEQARHAAQQKGVTGPLYAANLHLDVQLFTYSRPDASDFNAQGVQVRKLQTEDGAASQIEILGAKPNTDGTVSYTVTVLKLAIEIGDVSRALSSAIGSQVSAPLGPATGGSSGNSLQDFLNRSPYTQATGTQLWQYQTDDAMELLEQQERIDEWAADKQMRMLIEAAYQVLKYLQSMKIETAFNMSKEEKELFENALAHDPAEAVQKALHQFIKKKRLELEMLRKELKERLALQQQNSKHSELFANLERLINFYKQNGKMLEEQQIDKDKLKNLLGEVDQLNQSLKGQNFSWEPVSDSTGSTGV